jgi:CheY-like chemotaxis protein
MDHSYRALNGQNGGPGRGRPQRSRTGGVGTQYLQPEPEPLPFTENPETKIFAFVDDLFFSTKIKETARKLNVPVEFVKTDKDVVQKMGADGSSRSAMAIFDLNNTAIKPLTLITKLKAKLKKKLSIIAFVSHVQGELKVKAQEAGCDMVMPRSAFSQNLPQLLRRHGAPDENVETV